MVDIKVLQVVVEINTSSTQVSTEQSGVSGKDGSYVDMPLPAKGDSETGLPFVEVGNDCGFRFSGGKLISASILFHCDEIDSPLRGTMRQCTRIQ